MNIMNADSRKFIASELNFNYIRFTNLEAFFVKIDH